MQGFIGVRRQIFDHDPLSLFHIGVSETLPLSHNFITYTAEQGVLVNLNI